MKNKKTLINIAVSVLLTVIILILFFRNISVEDIVINLKKIPLSVFAVYLAAYLATTFLRAVKYRLLTNSRHKLLPIFLITLIRNCTVDLLPGRIASLFLYTFLLKKMGEKVEKGSASYIISVFYESFALGIMLIFLSYFINTPLFNPHLLSLFSLLIIIISALFIFTPSIVIKYVKKIKYINQREKIKKSFDLYEEFFSENRDNKKRCELFFLSFGIRILKYVSIYILFTGIVSAVPQIKQFALFTFGIAGTELSSLLPVSGISGFGTWDIVFKSIFSWLSITDFDSGLLALVLHVSTQSVEYISGLAGGILFFIYLKLKKNSA